MPVSLYLAFKELWRNRVRYLLVSLVIALITLLVLFNAALGEGLGTNNRQYVAGLDAQLIVFSEKADYLIQSSRLDQSALRAVRRLEGVADAGPISTANTAITLPDGKVLKVSLLGAQAGSPGMPPVVEGSTLLTAQAKEVVIDRNVALRSDIRVGDDITIRSTQGSEDEFFTLHVVGMAEGQAYFFQPSVFVSPVVWETVRPKPEAELSKSVADINVIAVKLDEPEAADAMARAIAARVPNVAVADIATTVNSIPGYTAQQGTVQTMTIFTLLIGILVIGGFFQIQVLQKVAQIGVLKAIGTSNGLVGGASVAQIMLVTALGVSLGGLFTFAFSLFFPPTVPLVFNGAAIAVAVAALLVVGPLGGLVSVIYAVLIEPLRALRLT